VNEIYTGCDGPHISTKINTDVDYTNCGRIAQQRHANQVKFGTCCSQVMALFLDIHTPK